MRNPFAIAAGSSLLAIAALVAALWRPGGTPGLDDATAPLELYCAAGLHEPVEVLCHEYERRFGVKIQPHYQASGDLIFTMNTAGTGDLYLPADTNYFNPARAKQVELREMLPIAEQVPVVAVHQGNPLGIRSLDDLKKMGVRLYLANPEGAAISKLARQLLGERRWNELWRRKIAAVPTVNAVANEIKLEQTGAGIVWDATAEQYPELEMIRVPEFANAKSQITLAVLGMSKQPTRALHFARFVAARDEGLAVFKKHAYKVVSGDLWAEGKPEIMLYAGGLNMLAVEQTVKEFERREGVTVLTKYQGCGTLVGDMKSNILPDVYFACETSFMDQVRDLFWEPVNVSDTDVVIIASKDNPRGFKTLADLAKDEVTLALADPKKSALGGLTERLFEKQRLLPAALANRRVTTSTAAEVVTAVEHGGIDAGIVYLANAKRQEEKLAIIPIADPEAVARQPIAVGRSSGHYYLSQRLIEAIRGPQSQKRFLDAGFRWQGENGVLAR